MNKYILLLLLSGFMIGGGTIASGGPMNSNTGASATYEDQKSAGEEQALSQSQAWTTAYNIADTFMSGLERMQGGWYLTRAYNKHRYGQNYKPAHRLGETVEFDDRKNAHDQSIVEKTKNIKAIRSYETEEHVDSASEMKLYAFEMMDDADNRDAESEKEVIFVREGMPHQGSGKLQNHNVVHCSSNCRDMGIYKYSTILYKDFGRDQTLRNYSGDELVVIEGEPVMYEGALVFKREKQRRADALPVNFVYVDADGNELGLKTEEVNDLPKINATLYPDRAVAGALTGLAGTLCAGAGLAWKIARWGHRKLSGRGENKAMPEAEKTIQETNAVQQESHEQSQSQPVAPTTDNIAHNTGHNAVHAAPAQAVPAKHVQSEGAERAAKAVVPERPRRARIARITMPSPIKFKLSKQSKQ